LFAKVTGWYKSEKRRAKGKAQMTNSVCNLAPVGAFRSRLPDILITGEKMSAPSPEQIRDFVIAGHGDFEKVKAMLAETPELLNAAHPWSETDRETALMAAAQVANRQIAEYLIERGAVVDICIASMMGWREKVAEMLAEDPERIHARGAHRIPLLAYAASSGNLELVKMLVESGAGEGVHLALENAIRLGYTAIAAWLLDHFHPDLNWKNLRGKTLLAFASEQGRQELADLLRAHGAAE
jgi:ankyrin repeat protein